MLKASKKLKSSFIILLLGTSALSFNFAPKVHAASPQNSTNKTAPAVPTPPSPTSVQPTANTNQTIPSQATLDPFQNPRANELPKALGILINNGTKVAALGDDGGVSGYLSESPEGKTISVYVMPDSNYVILGTMFRLDDGGKSFYVTGDQISRLKSRLVEAKRLADETRRQADLARNQADEAERKLTIAQQQLKPDNSSSLQINLAGGATLPIISSSTPPVLTPVAPPATPVTVSPSVTSSALPPVTTTNTSNLTPVNPTPVNTTNANVDMKKFVSPLDKTKVLNLLDHDVAWFSLGANDAPAIYMVADPQCPFCHAALEKLLPLIDDRRVKINIIISDRFESGSNPFAVSLLMQSNPGLTMYNTFSHMVNGVLVPAVPLKPLDASLKDSADAQKADSYVKMNNKFIDNITIKGEKFGTPFFAYVGKDGVLYSTFGLDDLGSFLSNLPLSPVVKNTSN